MNMAIKDDEFFRARMASTPLAKRGKEHVVKKNECLWNIARNELGNKAKKSEVLDYMYQIGKLNNKTSLQEMNNLKVNEKIYLPERANNQSPAKPVEKQKQVVTPTKPNTKTTPVVKPSQQKTNAELGFEDVKNSILGANINSLTINCGYKGLTASSYSVYRDKPNEPYIKKLVASFTMDKNHNLIAIKFNGRKDEVDIRYDFEIDRNGKIIQKDNFNINTPKTIANIDKQKIDQIEKVLQTLVKNYEKK